MRKLICFLIAIATACAADFSGKWTGTADIMSPDGKAQQQLSVVLQLRQSGNALTGTIGEVNGEQTDIASGAVSGSTISFEVRQGDNGPLWKIKLDRKGDDLSGDAVGTAGAQTLKGRLALKRSNP